MIRYCFVLLTLVVNISFVSAQNYHAINGSTYTGSLAVHNNPASIAMSPYKWDITLAGFQLKSSSNLITIYNYSLLSNPANSLYNFTGGDYKRSSYLSSNLNLLNTRIALNRKAAIAFGVNLKSYSNLSSSPYNFYDTLQTTGDFFKINNPGNLYSAKVGSSTWAEVYATYARTVIDNEKIRLNAGVTLKVSKGLSGASAKLEDAGFQHSENGGNQYNVVDGYAEYIYSSNYDHWQKNASNSENIKNFLKYTQGGISIDAGIEYIIKPQVITDINDEDTYYDYDWKFGLSLLDGGFNQYQSGNKSTSVSGVKPGVTDINLDNKFDSTITSFQAFNDSLSTIVKSFIPINNPYKIINPMRIVLNVDRYVGRNFYVNAELSVNVPSAWLKNWHSVKEMNLLTVTPRWETGRFGVFLPVQYTNTNRFWVGAAFKAGPILLGFHNLANIFTSNSVQNGGGYIALILRSPHNISKKYDKRLDCPVL